ncbi:chromogranin-A isoform X2 [Phascolarctos cinereus]|uniref:Chromogranin-A n=1 Tax=Phascolarctos cinereus TaxID=38626 RepID=A0A6P5LCK2_PHACI|nr:chromogranin-A isoform X2 [Phascolarctos cinereus]
MSFPAFFVLLVSAMQVIAFPVNSPANKSDTKVMRCIVEVISDTLSKPSPLPISEDCFETLRGDERIISILRHQNLLKELQELAIQGASERAQQQKKDRGFEDELSEVLESQNNEETIEKGELKDVSPEKSDEDGTESKEKKSLEEREAQPKETNPKEAKEDSDSNEISKTSEEVSLESTLASGLTKEEHFAPKPTEDINDQPTDSQENLDLKEKEQSSKRDEEANGEEEEEEEAHLAQGGNKETSNEEGPTGAFSTSSTLDENETSREDSRPKALDLNGEGKVMEEEARSQEEKGLSRRSEEEAAATEDIFSPRGSKSQELEEELSKEWEDSKRWNKMDELARELTAKKRMEESDSEEEPDRSMKLSFRSHKYDFGSPMGLPRRTWKAHSREDSIEAGLPLSVRGDPDEKKEEEGSANRRTEDQELESLAAIEAELEKVAHKLHELRRG